MNLSWLLSLAADSTQGNDPNRRQDFFFAPLKNRRRTSTEAMHTREYLDKLYDADSLVLVVVSIGGLSSTASDDYHAQSQKKDYLFNLGRTMPRKGQDVAVEVAQTANVKLVLAGHIMQSDYFDQFRSVVRLIPHIGATPATASYSADVAEPVLYSPEPAVYIGQLDNAQKDVWFGHACCSPLPSLSDFLR